MTLLRLTAMAALTLAVGCSGTDHETTLVPDETALEVRGDETHVSTHETTLEVRGDDHFPPGGVALDEHRTLGPPVVLANLTVWPVHTDAPIDLGEYLTLQEAQSKALAVICELGRGSDAVVELIQQLASGPVVNTLQVENKADLPILVLAGTLVKGGNQDRQIGQDFVIAAHSTVSVDAFCVEQGRWSAQRSGEQTGGLFIGQPFNVGKSVRMSGQYDANQGEVWKNVQAFNAIAGKTPVTSTLMATIEEDNEKVLAYRKELETAVKAHFAKAEHDGVRGALVGYAYAIGGKTESVRAFAHPRIFKKQFNACLKGFCLEAELAQRKARAEGGELDVTPASPARVKALVEELATATKRERMAGENRNLYRCKASVGGSAECLVLDEQGNVHTLTEDWSAE